MKSAGGHSVTVMWERGVFKGSRLGGLCFTPPGGSRIVPTGAAGLHCQDAGHTLVISPVSFSFFIYLCFLSLIPLTLPLSLHSLLSHFHSQTVHSHT